MARGSTSCASLPRVRLNFQLLPLCRLGCTTAKRCKLGWLLWCQPPKQRGAQVCFRVSAARLASSSADTAETSLCATAVDAHVQTCILAAPPPLLLAVAPPSAHASARSSGRLHHTACWLAPHWASPLPCVVCFVCRLPHRPEHAHPHEVQHGGRGARLGGGGQEGQPQCHPGGGPHGRAICFRMRKLELASVLFPLPV